MGHGGHIVTAGWSAPAVDTPRRFRSGRGGALFPRLARGLAPALLVLLLLASGCAKYPASTAPLGGTAAGKAISRTAQSAVGTPYRPGGDSPKTGFDCSGLVCWSYEQVGIQLPRSARDQIMFGTKVERQEDL